MQPFSKQKPHVFLFFYQTFDNSSASLPPVASLVNSSYDAANASLSEIQQTNDDSEQLLQDVVEAEGKISFKFHVPRAPA